MEKIREMEGRGYLVTGLKENGQLVGLEPGNEDLKRLHAFNEVFNLSKNQRKLLSQAAKGGQAQQDRFTEVCESLFPYFYA